MSRNPANATDAHPPKRGRFAATAPEENDGVVNTEHLRGPFKFAKLADVHVLLGTNMYPCHSPFLARYSQVLCELFSSTPREGWSEGISTLIDGHREDNWRLVLLCFYTPCLDNNYVKQFSYRLRSKSKDDIFEGFEDLLDLVHKLNASEIMQVCEQYVITNIKDFKPTLAHILRLLSLSSNFDLKYLHDACMNAALEILIHNDDPLSAMKRSPGSDTIWRGVTSEDGETLLMAVVQALGDCKRELHEVKYTPGGNLRVSINTFQFKPQDAEYRKRLLSQVRSRT